MEDALVNAATSGLARRQNKPMPTQEMEMLPMPDFGKVRSELQQRLPKGLFEHSVRVSETAAALAKLHGADPEKAALAGLLHDYAKALSGDELVYLAEAHDIPITELLLAMPVELLHAPVGAIMAERDFGVSDPAVLAAIRHHTLGAEEMPVLSKIVLLADKTEPGRKGDWVKPLRELADTHLDRALLAAFDATLGQLIQEGGLISEQGVRTRNKLILSVRRAGE